MDFANLRLFAYDNEHFPSLKLDDILAMAGSPTMDRFALSGAEDLVEALLIWKEWYEASTPRLPFKELKRARDGASMDGLYNEPADARRRFNREVLLHANVEHTKPDIKYSAQGSQLDQPIVLNCGLLSLHAAKYYPETGDEVIHGGRAYQITTVYHDEKAYFAHTGVPLHVTMTAEIWRQDGSPSRAVRRISSTASTAYSSVPLLQRLSGTNPA